MGLPDVEEIMTLAFFVLTQYRLVMDRRTDGQTDTLLSQRPARRYASAGKNLATNVTSTWPQLQSCRISVNLGVDCIVVYSTNVYSKLHPHNTGVRAWIYCRYNAPGLQRRLPVPMWTK